MMRDRRDMTILILWHQRNHRCSTMVGVPLWAVYTADLRALETLLFVHRLVLERQLGCHVGNVLSGYAWGEVHR